MTTGVHQSVEKKLPGTAQMHDYRGERTRATDKGPIACRRGSSTLLEATSSTMGERRPCTFSWMR